MKIDLSGKTALVTGSTSGIGHSIARGLASAGAEIVVNGRTQAKVDAAIAGIAIVSSSTCQQTFPAALTRAIMSRHSDMPASGDFQ